MKLNIIRSRVCLLLVFCSLSWFAVAQTNDDGKKLLLGEWVWEEASLPGKEYAIHLDLNNNHIKFYSEIEIKGDAIFLKEDEKKLEVKYEVDGNYLGYDLPSGESFIAEWVIIEDMLYLEFTGNDLYDASKKVNVLLVYKRK